MWNKAAKTAACGQLSEPRSQGDYSHGLDEHKKRADAVKLCLMLLAATLPCLSAAMGLMLQLDSPYRGNAELVAVEPPPAAVQGLTGSKASQGQRDIARAWLGLPTDRCPHTAVGSRTHAASLPVLAATPSDLTQELIYRLPFNRVFEDLAPRLADVDQNGRNEIIVIEADALRGASVVVLGLDGPPSGKALKEKARSPPAGSKFRWLNQVDVADYGGNGKQDVAAVITPHIGKELTLDPHRPPQLVPCARAMDISNNLMGSPELQLTVIMQLPGQHPTIIVADMSLKALHVLRWEGSGANAKFKELADVMPLPARVRRITLLPDTPGAACVWLADNAWRRVTLTNAQRSRLPEIAV